MGILRLVTITGADDQVELEDLIKLSGEFPFVEWGLLVSNTRAGTKRYPSLRWLENFAAGTPSPINCSLHVCGVATRNIQISGDGPAAVEHFYHRRASRRTRAQINGFDFERERTFEFRAWRNRHSAIEVILQAKGADAFGVQWSRQLRGIGVSFLQDESGGRGIAIEKVIGAPPDYVGRFGVAGGLTPDNVEEFLERHTTPEGLPFSWIDMETGARTEHDEFDLAQVRLFLERCARFT